jgi:hypothetical protein
MIVPYSIAKKQDCTNQQIEKIHSKSSLCLSREKSNVEEAHSMQTLLLLVAERVHRLLSLEPVFCRHQSPASPCSWDNPLC